MQEQVYNDWICYRNEINVNVLLSEEVLRKRQRTHTINLKMTIIAWTLEFLAGCLLLMQIFFHQLLNPDAADDLVWKRVSHTLDTIICSSIIPSSYILKSEEIKKAVILEGWSKPFRLLCPKCRSRVAVEENLNMNVIPNALPEDRVVHAQPHTIGEHEDDEAWLRRIDLFDEEPKSALTTQGNVEQILRVNPVPSTADAVGISIPTISCKSRISKY